MTRLHQVLPVKKTVTTDTAKALNEARQILGNGAWLTGRARTYQPKDEQGQQLPPENQRVQVRGEDILSVIALNLVRLFNLEATIDTANTMARGDIVVDDVTLVYGAPVSYLLFLEKHLEGLAGMLEGLPKLDPALRWRLDTATGLWVAEPVRTIKSQKTPRNHVKAEATDKHPAQVDVYYEDVPIGEWTTVPLSGAFPEDRVRDLRLRCAALRAAVVKAREQANSVEVTDSTIGKAVVDFLFAG